MAAGARLEAMRRRVRLSRMAVWTVIAAGPIAPCVAVASTPTTVAAAPASKPTAMRTATAATDPRGYAQVFVGAWLRSSTDDATSAQAGLAQAMAPDVELPDPAADAQSAPGSVTAVRSARAVRDHRQVPAVLGQQQLPQRDRGSTGSNWRSTSGAPDGTSRPATSPTTGSVPAGRRPGANPCNCVRGRTFGAGGGVDGAVHGRCPSAVGYYVGA